MQPNSRSNVGFTLIELTVTVAIVGIITAMALAQYDLYRQKTNDLLALSQLIQARTSFETLIADNVSDPNYHLRFSYGYGTSSTDELFSYKQSLSDGSVAWWGQPLPGYSHNNKVELIICGNSNSYVARSSHEEGTNATVEGRRGTERRNLHHTFWAGKITSTLYTGLQEPVFTCGSAPLIAPPDP